MTNLYVAIMIMGIGTGTFDDAASSLREDPDTGKTLIFRTLADCEGRLLEDARKFRSSGRGYAKIRQLGDTIEEVITWSYGTKVKISCSVIQQR